MEDDSVKCFVTGGSGFIGSHLVDRLIADGNVVTAYDNLSNGRSSFIEKYVGQDNFRFIKADVLDLETLTAAMEGSDVVFHLTANQDLRVALQEALRSPLPQVHLRHLPMSQSWQHVVRR